MFLPHKRARSALSALGVLISALVIFSPALSVQSFAGENGSYSVTVNGEPVEWDGAAPSMKQGRLTVPVGRFGDALGADVTWDEVKQEVFLFWNGRYVWLQAGNPTLYYGPYIQENGHKLTDVSPKELPVLPELEQSRLTAPLAPLVEALGGAILWDEETFTAGVSMPLPGGAVTDVTEALAESEPEEEEQGYFSRIGLDEVLTRYENDDPFVLVQYDGSLPSESLYDMMMAAADLRIKIYGLDITREAAARDLTFYAGDGYEVRVYLINGYERVTFIGDPGPHQAADALEAYMETE